MKSLLLLFVFLFSFCAHLAAKPLNILFFTADDMNYDSSAVFGGPIKDLTPHVDRLAAEGMRFKHAYSTVAVCQPVRQTMFCGLYPHRSGSTGFTPVKPNVRTLHQQLRDAHTKRHPTGISGPKSHGDHTGFYANNIGSHQATCHSKHRWAFLFACAQGHKDDRMGSCVYGV